MELVLVRVALRIAVIACAGILIIVSAITVGFVNSNDDFQREGGRNFQSIRQLDRLVDNTLSTAVWLLILSAIVLVWEGAQSTIAVATPRVGFLQRYSVVLTITDAVFSFLATLCFVGSFLACVVLADGWGEPPEACDQYSRYYKSLKCDHTHLEGTSGTAALMCIIQVLLFTMLGVLASSGHLSLVLACLQTLRESKRPSRSAHINDK